MLWRDSNNMEEWIDFIFASCGILICVGLIAFAIIKSMKSVEKENAKDNRDESESTAPIVPTNSSSDADHEVEDPDTVEELPIVEQHAKVIDMKCGTHVFKLDGRYAKLKATSQFLLTLEDDEGKIFDIFVNESMYLDLSIGDGLTLAYVDGKLFDYAKDDEAATE